MPHQPGGSFVNWFLMTTDQVRRYVGLDGVQSHDIARGVVQRERHKIHLHHSGEALGEIPKQFMQIAMGGERFRHFEEGSVSFRQSFARRDGWPVHTPQYGPITWGGSSGTRHVG